MQRCQGCQGEQDKARRLVQIRRLHVHAAVPLGPLVAELAVRPQALALIVEGFDEMALGQYGGAYLPFWRRQLAIILDGLRARADLTPLPGVALEFDEFHDMSHQKRPED